MQKKPFTSVISNEKRMAGGNPRWRGNDNPATIVEYVRHFAPFLQKDHPKVPLLFVDICEGSGSSRAAIEYLKKEEGLNIEYFGRDLHKGPGNNFVTDSIIKDLGREGDYIHGHPPYGFAIDYREVGDWADTSLKAEDTSACDIPTFLEKSYVMLMNQREATRAGGLYSTLIGDLRKNGKFYSFQSNFIEFMPKDELISVSVKVQHNCWSDKNTYRGMFVPIKHEYLIIWKKAAKSLFHVTVDGLKELKSRVVMTWRVLVRMALMNLGGQATLKDIYDEVAKVAGERLAENPTWQATVRRTLQHHFDSVNRGVWAMPQAA